MVKIADKGILCLIMMIISLCEEGFQRNEDRFYEIDQGGLSFSLA